MTEEQSHQSLLTLAAKINALIEEAKKENPEIVLLGDMEGSVYIADGYHYARSKRIYID
jgi:hypothetical protein